MLDSITVTIFLLILIIIYGWPFLMPSSKEYDVEVNKPREKNQHKDKIGLKGIALMDLKPTGKILIDGNEYMGSSEIGFISKGDSVVVTSIGDFELKVRKE